MFSSKKRQIILQDDEAQEQEAARKQKDQEKEAGRKNKAEQSLLHTIVGLHKTHQQKLKTAESKMREGKPAEWEKMRTNAIHSLTHFLEKFSEYQYKNEQEQQRLIALVTSFDAVDGVLLAKLNIKSEYYGRALYNFYQKLCEKLVIQRADQLEHYPLSGIIGTLKNIGAEVVSALHKQYFVVDEDRKAIKQLIIDYYAKIEQLNLPSRTKAIHRIIDALNHGADFSTKEELSPLLEMIKAFNTHDDQVKTLLHQYSPEGCKTLNQKIIRVSVQQLINAFYEHIAKVPDLSKREIDQAYRQLMAGIEQLEREVGEAKLSSLAGPLKDRIITKLNLPHFTLERKTDEQKAIYRLLDTIDQVVLTKAASLQNHGAVKPLCDDLKLPIQDKCRGIAQLYDIYVDVFKNELTTNKTISLALALLTARSQYPGEVNANDAGPLKVLYDEVREVIQDEKQCSNDQVYNRLLHKLMYTCNNIQIRHESQRIKIKSYSTMATLLERAIHQALGKESFTWSLQGIRENKHDVYGVPLQHEQPQPAANRLSR